MKVKELIRFLQSLDKEEEVYLATKNLEWNSVDIDSITDVKNQQIHWNGFYWHESQEEDLQNELLEHKTVVLIKSFC